jgi:hypothetical protein
MPGNELMNEIQEMSLAALCQLGVPSSQADHLVLACGPSASVEQTVRAALTMLQVLSSASSPDPTATPSAQQPVPDLQAADDPGTAWNAQQLVAAQSVPTAPTQQQPRTQSPDFGGPGFGGSTVRTASFKPDMSVPAAYRLGPQPGPGGLEPMQFQYLPTREQYAARTQRITEQADWSWVKAGNDGWLLEKGK